MNSMKMWVFKARYKQKTERFSTLQRHHVGYLSKQDKNKIKTMKQLGRPIYVYVSSMAIEGCWHVTKVAPNLQIEVCLVLLSHATSVEIG